jgi:hypothetical protein
MKTRIILPALYLFPVFSCENKNKKFDEEIDNFMNQEFTEPDLFFEIAVDGFNEKNFKSSAEGTGNAVFFLSTLNFEDDTTHQGILEVSIKQM